MPPQKPTRFSALISRLEHIYTEDGRFRGALLEDLLLLASVSTGFYKLAARDRSPDDGFFDSRLTLTTVSIVAAVMIIYHLLWRILEATSDTHRRMGRERLVEQVPRFGAALFLLIGLYNFSTNLPLFIVSLVLFYLLLVIWHGLISSEMRRARGTIVFDCFGLFCAIAFAVVAFDLYLKSRTFWSDLPRYVGDPLSADVVRRSFAGKQTILVYTMGVCAGAMAANAILALIRGLLKR